MFGETLPLRIRTSLQYFAPSIFLNSSGDDHTLCYSKRRANLMSVTESLYNRKCFQPCETRIRLESSPFGSNEVRPKFSVGIFYELQSIVIKSVYKERTRVSHEWHAGTMELSSRVLGTCLHSSVSSRSWERSNWCPTKW